MRAQLAGLAILIIAAGSAASAPVVRTVGKWAIRTEKDPFDKGTTTIAVTMRGENSLVLRCFGTKLSVILILPTNKREFSAGQDVSYQYRSDSGPITSHEGTVFGDYSVELPNAAQILRDVPTAKSLAFRVTLPGGLVSTFTFEAAGGSSATAGIRADCASAIAATSPAAAPPPPPPSSKPAEPSPSERLSEDVIARLSKQMFADARDAIAYSANCDTLVVDDKKLLLAITLQDAEPNAGATALSQASTALRAELLKDKDRNLCADAYVLFGPLGTQFRNFVRLKGAAASGAQQSVLTAN